MIQKASLLFAIATSIAIAALAAAPPAATPPSGGDEAAIRAQTTAWVKAYNGGDAKTAAAQYADDALLLPPGSPGQRGHAAILAFLTKEIAGSKTAGAKFNLNSATDVGVSGTLGWESGTFTVTINGAVVESGKFLSVSQKKAGKWLYIRDTWNSDTPPAPPVATPKKQ